MGSVDISLGMMKGKEKIRSRKLSRFVVLGKTDYVPYVCAVCVLFFFVVLFLQMFLPGSVIENENEVMKWQIVSELDFGENVELMPIRVLAKFDKEWVNGGPRFCNRKPLIGLDFESSGARFGGRKPLLRWILAKLKKYFETSGPRFGSRKPLIAMIFADLLIDPDHIQMVTVTFALREIGYEMEVFALEDGPAGDVWKKVGVPVNIFKIAEKKQVLVDWLRYDGIIVNSIEAREAFSCLLQEPFKSVPVMWRINDRTLSTHLRRYAMKGQFDLVNDWQRFFNRSTVVVFPNYALPMYYSRCDAGNYFVVPGSPAEAWEANNFMFSHKDDTSAEINNFVIVIVGSQFMYKGLWLEHSLVLKALLPLLPEFSSDHDSRSHLKIIILSGDSTGNYSMAMEAIASKLKYPKDTVRHASLDEDPNKILSMSDLVIYGSFLEELTFPSILVKAMSFGKPIIAPNLSMIRKCVDDRVNGYLFPKEDIRVLSQILMLVISEGNLTPSSHGVASKGKATAKNLMVSETIEGYASLLENVLKLPSEVELPKPISEIPSNLKEEWQWKLFESISDLGYPKIILKVHNSLHDIGTLWNPTQAENSGALNATDETFLYRIWEEEKSIESVKKGREEDQLKDRTDQTRGTWEDLYRNAKKADRTKNVLHERDDGELERTGQPLTIYEPYFGEGTWPFLHQNSLYRGLGLSTKGRRPGTDDIDAPSRLPLLNNPYYRDALGEFGGFFAIANRVDRVHRNAWIGFQSWRATARKDCLTKVAETAILEDIQARRHGDTLYFWSRMDTDPRNSLKQEFWSFCDAINAGNCKFAYSEAMKNMYGIKDSEFSLPFMPLGEDTWSVMHTWVLPTRSFLEFVMFSRMFVDMLDTKFYDEHHQTGHCRLSLSKDKHCYSRVLELLVNVWAYHSARRMIYVNPETGTMQEQHKLKSRRGKMWVKWFSFSILKSMDEDLAEEFDTENSQRRWLWPNTGEVYWQGMYEKERRKRMKEKEERQRARKDKLERMNRRHGQKVIGKFIKPLPEEDPVDGGLNSTMAAVAEVMR